MMRWRRLNGRTRLGEVRQGLAPQQARVAHAPHKGAVQPPYTLAQRPQAAFVKGLRPRLRGRGHVGSCRGACELAWTLKRSIEGRADRRSIYEQTGLSSPPATRKDAKELRTQDT